MASCPRCTQYVASHPLHETPDGYVAVHGPCFHKCPEPFSDVEGAASFACSVIALGAPVSSTMKARLRLTLEGPYQEKGPWRG